MASWILVPCLVSLRAEFDRLAPGRDKRSDGVIGDVTHQAGGTSDHLPDEDFSALRGKDSDSVNEVHAIDVDNDLKRPPITFDQCIQIIVTRHRTGQDNRLQNVIWNRRIWSRSWGWTARAYTGASQHTEHGHFSARYGSGTTGNPEADTRPWGLLALIEGDDDMATITQADFNTRMDVWWNDRMNYNAKPLNPALVKLRVAPWQQEVGQTGKSTHDTLFGTMLTLLQQAAGGDVDPAVVAQMVIAGLDPQQIVTAVVAALPVDLAKQTADEIYARLAA